MKCVLRLLMNVRRLNCKELMISSSLFSYSPQDSYKQQTSRLLKQGKPTINIYIYIFELYNTQEESIMVAKPLKTKHVQRKKEQHKNYLNCLLSNEPYALIVNYSTLDRITLLTDKMMRVTSMISHELENLSDCQIPFIRKSMLLSCWKEHQSRINLPLLIPTSTK